MPTGEAWNAGKLPEGARVVAVANTSTAVNIEKLIDAYGLAVIMWRNSLKRTTRAEAHREVLEAKRALLNAYGVAIPLKENDRG